MVEIDLKLPFLGGERLLTEDQKLDLERQIKLSIKDGVLASVLTSVVLKALFNINYQDSDYTLSVLDQGFQGKVEILDRQDVNYCIKRAYTAKDIEIDPSLEISNYKQEFEIQNFAYRLGISTPMPIEYLSFTVFDKNGEKIDSLRLELIIMEAIKGENLLSFTPDRVKDLEAFREAFLKLRQDLEKLHNNGLYHGDLSFKNLIVRESLVDGKIKYDIYIIDFGRSYYAKEDRFANDGLEYTSTDMQLYQHLYKYYFGKLYES